MVKILFKNLKMKKKIVLVSVVTIILMWSAIVIVAISSIRNIYDKKIDQIIQQTVEQTSKYVSAEYGNIINLVYYSANMEELQSAIRMDVNGDSIEYIYAQSVISPILSQLRMQNRFIESTGLIFKDRWFYGDIYTMNYEIDEIMEKVRITPLIYWSSESVFNEATGKEVLPVVIKLPNGGLNIENEAYMVVNIDVQKMFDYMHDLEEKLQCYLIIHSGSDVIFGNQELFHTMDESGYIVNNSKIEINGWNLTFIMDRQDMYMDMNRTIMNMVIISIVIVVICILMANYVSSSITTPIHKLIDQTRKIEKGDFSVRGNFNGKDEIGELGRSFNAMSSQIERYIKMLEDEKKQVEISEGLKRKAEMKALQSQINPHFLYNTLDSLYWYSLSGKREEIGQIVIDLSMLLRIGLSKGAETITIESEVEHVGNYLKIQKTIFSDKFDYQIQTDSELFSFRIIKILLQPLAENSLNHGFANMETGGFIDIRLERQAEYLIITVSDNGCGFNMDTEKNKSEFSGYALTNISERLRLHYEKDAELFITSEPNVKTTVTIKILLKKLV